MKAGRILFLDQFGTMGGGQRVLMSLMEAARQEFAEVAVLAPSGPLENAIGEEFGGGVAYHHCPEPPFTHGKKTLGDIFKLCAYAWRFRRYLPLLRNQQVIYVNGLRHLPHMLLFGLLLKARVIYHIHLAHTRLERGLIRLAAHWPGTFQLVACSAFVARQLKGMSRLRVIGNALDRRFAERDFVDRFSEPVRALAVLGTIRPEKGQDIAMDAMVSQPGMNLHLIGRVGDGAQAWTAALRARHAPNVFFDGPTVNIPARLDELQIQINVVPSRWQEPFGLVTIEGMACSCITIVSGTGGLADVAKDTGAIIARDAASLVAALDTLKSMPGPQLAALARGQFEATQRIYAPERFQSQVRALLGAARDAAEAHAR